MSFFDGKKPAAILKHSIMDQYVHPFVGKTGRYSLNHRVAVIDGYAGEGRYESGDEASPALLIRKARSLLSIDRRLESYFVESEPHSLAKLQQVIKAEAADLPVQLFPGSIEEHLDHLLTLVKEIPLLAFLDPFGLMIPFEHTEGVLAQRPKQGPATELLINFNGSGLRRVAGALTSGKAYAGREATLARMDETCGGDWWRQVWLDHGDDKEKAEEAVVVGYAQLLSQRQGCGWWTTPVRNRAHHMPVYYLVFITRHRDGFSEFGEALSRGLGHWRKALHDTVDADTLFGDEAAFKASEQSLVDGWVNEIEQNLRRLLQEGRSFGIYERYAEVYGEAAGQAREMHLRAAWKRIYPNVTRTQPKGSLIKRVIEPA
jgi:three-Cys-motif partner protein